MSYSRCTISLELNESKTQFRGFRWRRQVANYSLAMTQWQPILERFAAVDLRSFLLLKVGVESIINAQIYMYNHHLCILCTGIVHTCNLYAPIALLSYICKS